MENKNKRNTEVRIPNNKHQSEKKMPTYHSPTTPPNPKK